VRAQTQGEVVVSVGAFGHMGELKKPLLDFTPQGNSSRSCLSHF
jgi:hypothetical protein